MQSDTNQIPAKRQHRMSRRILLLGIVFSLGVLASTALYLDGKRSTLLSEGITNIKRFNTLLLEQTVRVYDSVDILLRATVTKLEDGEMLSANDEKKLYDLLNSYITGMPHIRGLSLMGTDGHVIATTFRYPTSHPDYSDRVYFQQLRDSTNLGMYIDAPVRRKSDPTQWLLNVARRIPTPDGDFAGVAVVSLVPEYFSSFYESLDLVEGSYVSLLREDSTLLIRHPTKDEQVGKVFGRNPAIQPFIKQRLPHTSLRMYSYISETDILLDCRFAKSDPFYLCISTIEDKLLGEWNKDAVTLGVVATFISLVIMALFLGLSKQMRKRELIAAELIQSNRDLDKLSKTDYLTGLANRHFIEARIAELLGKASRHQRPFALVLIDIDHFKEINDTHGHAVGDRVLRQLSDIFSERIRVSDMVGRWGGEEFLIVCDESDLNGASQLAETLRGDIQNYDFQLPSPLTSSFGVTEYRANEDADQLFVRVDKLLYNAKNSGRNRVVSG
ncbi:MAG: sensor domain-containing diguanylate cyclase [Halopseudomonas sp.]